MMVLNVRIRNQSFILRYRTHYNRRPFKRLFTQRQTANNLVRLSDIPNDTCKPLRRSRCQVQIPPESSCIQAR